MNLKYNNYPALARGSCPVRKNLEEFPEEYPWESLTVLKTFVDDSCLCVLVEVDLARGKYIFADWHLSEEEFAAYFFIQNGSFTKVDMDPVIIRIRRLIDEE